MKARIKKYLHYATWFTTFSSMMVISLIISIPIRFSSRYKNLWVIAERPDEARDNAYWLYIWILENHPEVNVRFIVSRSSPDYLKLKRKDLVIEPNTLKHYIYYILSSKAISTHMHGASPGKAFCIPFLPLMRKKSTVFIQHGVITNTLPLRDKMDMVVASSKKEAKLIIKSNPRLKKAIRLTGLARYDNLPLECIDKNKHTILVMPTFRKWLRDIARTSNREELFMKSEYYTKWMSLLNSETLNQKLSDLNVELIFYIHHELQAVSHTFKSYNKKVIIADQANFDVQELLIKSSVLITDYSSVLFDVAYMKKPVIYYQFDTNKFFGKHYKVGYPYPFGNVHNNEQSLLDELLKVIDENYRMDEIFEKEVDQFYEYRDSNNTERNFKAIQELSP